MSNDISDISAIEYAATQQTIDVTVMTEMLNLSEQELKELHQFHFWLKTQRQARLAECPVLQDPDEIEDGKTLGSIIGGIIGIGLSFIIPGIGLATGLAIGASIGGLAGAALQRPEDESKKAERRSRPSYGITSNKALVKLGDPVPLIFTNRDRNPNGGVRLTGQLICSWIDTFKGAQKLYEQYVLCLGEIGAVDVGKTLLDGQELDNFLSNEINITTRSGSQTQGAMANFPFYAQAVSPQLNTQLGLDLRSIVEEIKVQRKETIGDINWRQNMVVIRTESNCNVEKNGTANGFITTKDAIRSGKDGFVQAQVLRANRRQAIAITNASGTPGTNPDVLPFVFSLLENGTYTVRINNAAVTTAVAYARNDIFTIEYVYNQVLFRRNGAVVHAHTGSRVYPARLAVYIIDGANDADGTRINDLRVGNNISYRRGGTKPGQGTVIELQAPRVDEDEDLSSDELLEMARNETDQFNPSETYFVAGQDFRITNKNWNAATVTADRILTLAEGNQIYCRWTPNIETSKKVNELHVNLVARVFARDDKNKLIKHGVCFDCFIRSTSTGWTHVFRGLIASSTEGEIRRYFKIKNLPLDKYKIELRPLRSVDSSRTIYRLGDTGGRDNQTTSAVIGGRSLQVESQVEGTATATETNKMIRFSEEDKPVVSSQQGAPIAITSINEVVFPRGGQPPRYLGFALAGVEYLASERIQSAPTPNFLMQRGIITRAHIAAGTVTSVTSGLSINDINAQFLAQIDPARTGDTIRNLDKHIETSIAGLSGTNIFTNTSLQWEVGDRYLVYRNESINYFPDVYAFVLGDPVAGLGAQIDRDEWLEYPSFVKARQFCVRDQYFWDGTVSDLTQWRQWAASEAVGSRLLPCRINGRFGLLPEEETPIVWLFNASNVKDYKEEWIDWSQAACNSLVVSYTDTRDDFRTKTVTIQSPEATLGLEPIREKNLQLPSVTTRTQAIRSGSVVFKSPRIQTRSISFTTGQQGCYLKPGDLIQGQHVATEWNFERSGVVKESVRWSPMEGWSGFPPMTGTQEIKVSVPLEADRSFLTYRAAVQYKDTGETVTGCSCEISASLGQTQRTAKIRGLTRPLSVRDTVIFGEDLEDRRTYRIASIRPTENGEIEIVALYWHRDILSLDGITIDGICNNGQSIYQFNQTELTEWLAGSGTHLTGYTRNTLPLLINASNLVANSFHESLLRARELPATAGTAVGQFMLAKACGQVYKATNDSAWLVRSRAYAQAAIDRLYNGVPVPANPVGVNNWMPHRLFIAKGATLTKGTINNDVNAYGHFDVTVAFTNGVGSIPWAGFPTIDLRPLVANIYSVRRTGTLAWQNVDAMPVPSTTVAGNGIVPNELTINYWIGALDGGGGQRYRIYPTSDAYNGRLTTATTDPVGFIVLSDTTFTGNAIVTFSTYTGSTLQQNTLMEAYPMWRSTVTGEINADFAALTAAYETYELLEQIDSAVPQWRNARIATQNAIISASAIQNETFYFRKSGSSIPLDYPGTAIARFNNSAGHTVTRVTSTANGRQNFIQIVVNDGVEANPSIELQNVAIKTRFEDEVAAAISVEIGCSVANALIEVALTVSEIVGFTIIHRAWMIASSNVNSNRTKVFRLADFVNWNTTQSANGHFLWHPTILNDPSTVPITSSIQGTGTVSIARVETTIGQLSPVAWAITLAQGASGFAAVALNITQGALTNNPPSIYYKSTGDTLYRAQDNANNWYGVTLPNTNGLWQRFTPAWTDMFGAIAPVTTAPVRGVEIIGQTPAAVTVTVYYLARDAEVQPSQAGVPYTAIKAALISRITTAHTIWLGNFKPIGNGNTLDELPYTPGAFSETVNQLNGSIDSWRGGFYMGYQSPWIWLKLNDREKMNIILSLLRDSMDHYDIGHVHVRGGFTPIYLPNLWRSADYQASGFQNANFFTWLGNDPNTGWSGYFTRVLLDVAKLYSIEPGSKIAEDILIDAFKLINSFYAANGKFPTTFREAGEPLAEYEDPHVAAMIMQAAVLANVAGLDPAVSFQPIRNAYEYLRSQYVSSGIMGGSFTAGQPAFGSQGHRENFSFWVAAEIEAIGTLLLNVKNLKQPC